MLSLQYASRVKTITNDVGAGYVAWLSDVGALIDLPPPPPYAEKMGCGAVEASGLDFVCFVVLNSCQQSWFGLFVLFPILLPPGVEEHWDPWNCEAS